MAPSAAPTDPLKSLEGMWKGSLIRLANYFKDPAGYGQQTQTVLRSTAKRYQDALDDCEIHILEAKWYLEHHLALNRARRAQQASESTHTANKRKLDLLNDEQHDDTGNEAENPAKRIKVQEVEDSDTLVTDNSVAPLEDATIAAKDTSQDLNGNDEVPNKSAKATKETVQETNRSKQAGESNQRTGAVPKKPPDLDTANGANFISTDMASQDELKTSRPATSDDENQGLNFDSMFDDTNDGGDGNNADLGFDMDLGTDPFANAINDQNTTRQANNSGSLDSLLPVLENYANQTGDIARMNFNSSNVDGTGMDSTAGGPSNMFDLPDLGDSTFDDLLNDDSLGEGMGGAGDDMLNDDSMMNLGDFEDSFFNI